MKSMNLGDLAVVTMLYNEEDFLPIWKKYYSGQVGSSNCYIIDHGSDTRPCIVDEDFSVIRLPRSPMDNKLRAKFVSEMCSNLLKYYKSVIYTDIDEIIVVDPTIGIELKKFSEISNVPVSACFGLELFHSSDENKIDLNKPILGQRNYAVPHYSMMKPLFIRENVEWGPGFHASNAPYVFEGLYNFHLASFDLDIMKRRQEKRQKTEFSVDNPLHHHKMPSSEVAKKIAGYENFDSLEQATFDRNCPDYMEITTYMTSFLKINDGRRIYRPEKPWPKRQKWRIPARFRDAF